MVRSLTGSEKLLIGLILIQFFPLPWIPVINVAPENFLFLMAIIMCGASLGRLLMRGGPVSVIPALILAFAVLAVLHDKFVGEFRRLPAEHVRAVIYLLLLARCCSNSIFRLRIIKLLVVIGMIQVVFGTLIFVFGEPFASVRGWMLKISESVMDINISQGSQLAGLYGPPHIFGYLVASWPILAIMLFYLERKTIWLVAIVIMALGLFLNAERSSLASVVLGIIYLASKTGQRGRAIGLLIAGGILFAGAQQLLGVSAQRNQEAMTVESSYAAGSISERLGETSFDDVVGRIMWGVHGVVSVIKNPWLGPSPAEYAREVLGESNAAVSNFQIQAVPPSHNHYVNSGVRGGVLGWLITVLAFTTLWKVHQTARYASRRSPQMQLEYLGISVALGCVMFNALFHNAGMFSPELATTTLLGVFLGYFGQITSPLAGGMRRPVEPREEKSRDENEKENGSGSASA